MTAVGITGRIASRWISIVALITPVVARSQPLPSPDSLAPIVSMGFPTRYHWYAGGLVGSDRRTPNAEVAGYGLVGFYRDMKQPSAGILGFSLEGYAGRISGKAEGGMRALLTVRAIRIALGEDLSFGDGIHDFVVRYDDPIVRGGFFRSGALMRFEWLPGRHNSYNFGLTVPLFQPWAGKTRPTHQSYRLPPGPPAQPAAAAYEGALSQLPPMAAAAFSRARAAALKFDALTTPLPNVGSPDEFRATLAAGKRVMETREPEFPNGHVYGAEVAYYHRQLTLAFAEALGVEPGAAVADSITAHARAVLLDQVLIPFNRRFGWFRDNDILDALVDRSTNAFASWAGASSTVPSSRRGEALAAYRQLTDIVKAAFLAENGRWHDSRLIWTPFQLALRDEDHRTQSQIDSVIERLVASPFTRGNSVTYLASERFTHELIRTIRSTRDYHVLWIHDIKGGPSSDEPDTISAHLVIDGYLTALTLAVKDFDRTRRIPTFLIFLDEWYYELQRGRYWLELLRDPLRADLEFGSHAREIQHRTQAAIQELRSAVAQSPALQAEARRRGDAWLRNVVSVHVNITNPGDPSFPGRLHTRDLTLALADDFMRDHRKLVFYDVTEDDPGSGGAIFTGEGVGEQYAEGAWEDRSLGVRGAGILPLKQYARELLKQQGFADDQIPLDLRQRPIAPDYARKVDSLIGIGWIGRLTPVNSRTGYDDKIASAAKAALYTLMPPGSRIVAPDSQWSSFLWASMLGGAALRGCQVFVIGPGPENAPYGRDSWPMFSLQHDVFSSMIQAAAVFRDEIAAAGGALHVGLYQGEVGTRDFENRVRELSAGVRRNPFVRSAFPLPASLYDLMEDPDRVLRAIGYSPPASSPDDSRVRPKLHLKSQLYASREFVENVLPLPQWHDIIMATLRARARASEDARAHFRPDTMLVDAQPNSYAALAPLEAPLRARTPAERNAQVVYLTLGSQNQDDRSLFGNGEVLAVISSEAALAGLTDYVYLVARTTWLESVEEFDRIQPPVSPVKRRLARWLRRLI